MKTVHEIAIFALAKLRSWGTSDDTIRIRMAMPRTSEDIALEHGLKANGIDIDATTLKAEILSLLGDQKES